MKEELKPTEKEIMSWAMEMNNLKAGDDISEEMWIKIQYVASYVFNREQIKNSHDNLN